MGMGIPTIMSVPEGEATQIIEETKSGIVVESENVEQITQAIELLYTDAKLYSDIRSSSIAAAPSFSRDLMADKMSQIFEFHAPQVGERKH